MADKDFELEALGGESHGIVLETNVSKCKVCGVGDVLDVKNEKLPDKFMIYTRDGTVIVSTGNTGVTTVHCHVGLGTIMDMYH